MPSRTTKRRARGHIRRRGNSYEIAVYAGPDPLTGKDTYLRATAHNEREAERARTRLLAKVDQQRSASTSATLAYTLDRWLAVHDAEPRTVDDYRGFVERTINPAIGNLPISRITALMLEQFYAELRRCRDRCDGQPRTDHATTSPHECGSVIHRRKREHDCQAAKCRVLSCGPHACSPMSAGSIREIHFIISGALSAATRWEWIPTNPATTAKKPRQPRPHPSPPSPEDAARLVNTASADDAQWGTLIWLAMITGARRGELAALRWYDVDLDRSTLEIRRSYSQKNGTAIEKTTKTHQMRRIALDRDTVQLLEELHLTFLTRMADLDVAPSRNAFVFSYAPDNSRPIHPDAITHRYRRTCAALGISSHFHALRHYSATELITAGVDIRTVAGRLGHGGGGNTTLRVYSAWVPETDKRAATALASRLRQLGHSAAK